MSLSFNTMRLQNGLGMIESLIALVIISIGLLGIAALQLTGLQQSASAHWHSQAVWMSYEMTDRIAANSDPVNTPAVFNQYDGIDTDNGYSMDCKSNPCTQDQMVTADAQDWANMVQTLPNGRGVISSPGGANALTVSVMWEDNAGVSNCTNGEPVGTDFSCFTVTITQ